MRIQRSSLTFRAIGTTITAFAAASAIAADVRALDLAGVKLGMTPDAARRALRAKGFTPRASDPTHESWARRIAERVSPRSGAASAAEKVPMFTMASGAQGERIEIWYAVTPTGAEVSQVKFMVPEDRVPAAVFAQGLQTRYGEPTARVKARSYHCVRADADCTSLSGSRMPRLNAEPFDAGMHRIELSEGSDAAERRRAEFAAAVKAAAPPGASATF